MKTLVAMMALVSFAAGRAAEPGSVDPKQTVEYRALLRIGAAYRGGKPHEARPLLTSVGKEIADRVFALAWVDVFEFTPLECRDVPNVGFLSIGRHTELRVRADAPDQTFLLLVTFFNEAGTLRVHDVFVEEPLNRFLSERPTLPEIRHVAAARRLRDAAKAVAADPSDWRGGAKHLAEFREASAALRWQARPAVKRFASAGDDAVRFATTWSQVIETASAGKASEERRAEIEAIIKVAMDKLTIQAGGKSVEKVAEELSQSVRRRVEKLSVEQSEEFGRRQRSLNEAFDELLRLVNESRLLVDAGQSHLNGLKNP